MATQASSAPYNCLGLCLAQSNFSDIHWLPSYLVPVVSCRWHCNKFPREKKRIEVCNRGQIYEGVETKVDWEEYMGEVCTENQYLLTGYLGRERSWKAHWRTISEKGKHHGKMWVRSLWNLPVPMSQFTHWPSPLQRTMAALVLSGLASRARAVVCIGMKNHKQVLLFKLFFWTSGLYKLSLSVYSMLYSKHYRHYAGTEAINARNDSETLWTKAS